MARSRQVTVYSRENCHLCEVAIADVERVAADVGVDVALSLVDVDEDETLRRIYGDRVPHVVVDGRPRFSYRIDEAELRRLLREPTTGDG